MFACPRMQVESVECCRSVEGSGTQDCDDRYSDCGSVVHL